MDDFRRDLICDLICDLIILIKSEIEPSQGLNTGRLDGEPFWWLVPLSFFIIFHLFSFSFFHFFHDENSHMKET